MTKTLFFLLLLLPYTLTGQLLSKQALLEDLTYLNDAVTHGHPVNYNPKQKLNLLSVLEAAKAIESDSISPFEYSIWIERGIYHIGCIHTSLQANPIKPKSKPSFIPLTATIQNDALTIVSCKDQARIGEVIQKVNGRSASELIACYSQYKASDGGSNAFSTEYFHLLSSRLISEFLGNPDQYEVETSNDTYTLQGQNKVFFNQAEAYLDSSLLSNGTNHLYLKDDFALLRVNDFNKSDRAFFKRVFQKIDALNTEKLILDLRQNTGGNRNATIALTKHLVDSTFAYSILKPKLKTGNYLNGKGKFFLFLSKLKYFVGDLLRSHKTPLGREFTYRYKPSSKHSFKGELYVLTDGFTASASTMVTSWIKRYRSATFIGRQAGGGYNGNNGGSFPSISLPNSQMRIRFPAYRLILDHQSTFDAGIIPDMVLDEKTDVSEIIELIQKQ